MTESKNKVVVIKPLSKPKFSGLSSYPKATVVLTTELSKSGYKTGLTKEEEVYYEELLGLPKGKLSKVSDFWAELDIRLNLTKNTELDLNDPINQLKFRVLRESSKVCNSPLEKMKWPEADFIIIDEEEVAKVESVHVDFEIKAYEHFFKTTPEERRGILKLYGKKGYDKASENVVYTTLAKLLKEDPKRFLEIITDKKIKTRIFIEELLEAGIIKRRGNYYTNGDDPIGNSTEEVIHYFEDLKNQSIKMALEGKLKSNKD